MPSPTPATGLPLLRYWRRVRGMSQLALSSTAGVSTRHISFLESGRAQPSRWILGILAEALTIPARDRDELFVQAGFAAPRYGSAISPEDLAQVLAKVDEVIALMEPYPCLVLDRCTRIVKTNRIARALLELLTPPALLAADDLSVARVLLAPEVRRVVGNLPEIGPSIIAKLRRQAAIDPSMSPLLEEARADATIPASWWTDGGREAEEPIRRLDIAIGGRKFAFLMTTASLGTAADITFDELWLETYLPRDEQTDSALRAIATSLRQPP